MTDIDLIKQALEYLEDNQHHIADHERHTYVMMYNDCITALKARLAQSEQEPVCPACKAKVLYECVACSSNNYPPPHRTEPLIGCVNHDCAKCKPLTDEQRQELMSKAWNKWLSNKDDGRLFAWDFSFEVEAAHGIKEDT